MSYLDAWADKHNCAVLILAHPPKSEAVYSGSTDWQGSARCMWTLVKEKKDGQDDLYKLEVIKSNYALFPQPVTLDRGNNGAWIDTTETTYGTNNGQTRQKTDRRKNIV